MSFSHTDFGILLSSDQELRVLAMQCRVVQTKEECCTGHSVVLCPRRNEAGAVVGWYIGPLDIKGDRIGIHFLPKAESVLGPVAVLRASELAKELGLELVIYDPERLLSEAWIA